MERQGRRPNKWDSRDADTSFDAYHPESQRELGMQQTSHPTEKTLPLPFGIVHGTHLLLTEALVICMAAGLTQTALACRHVSTAAGRAVSGVLPGLRAHPEWRVSPATNAHFERRVPLGLHAGGPW